MTIRTGTRLSIFPLAGAILFPRAHLPLHIFEPRYRALVRDALASDRRIAMIQPLPGEEGEVPALFDIGCVGRISQVEAMPDGRFNLILEGTSRFRLLREIEAGTPFRQIEASLEEFTADLEEDPPPLASVQRAELEGEARAYAEARGYGIDWDAVGRLDDETLVNAIAQVAPFDMAAKQALLESANLVERADLLVRLMRFFGDDDGESTLQ